MIDNIRLKFRIWHNKYNKYLYNVSISNINNEVTAYEIKEDRCTEVLCNDHIEIEWNTCQTDTNGKLIYEGDILYDSSEDRYLEVVWDNTDSMFRVKYEDESLSLADCYFENLEVAGNKHQWNPEVYEPVESNFSELVGKTVERIEGLYEGSEQIIFECSDGSKYKMYHEQDCCENVQLEEFSGYKEDLIGEPILKAEERISHKGKKLNKWDDSRTWTFYSLATKKGYVDIRWYGTSNGYYSEEVNFVKIK